MGSMKGPYVVHGTYSRVKGVDIWGGFRVSDTFKANLTVPDKGTYSLRVISSSIEPCTAFIMVVQQMKKK